MYISGGARDGELDNSGIIAASSTGDSRSERPPSPHQADEKWSLSSQQPRSVRLRLGENSFQIHHDRIVEVTTHLVERSALHNDVKIKAECLPLVPPTGRDAYYSLFCFRHSETFAPS